jgi:hypothetical protein
MESVRSSETVSKLLLDYTASHPRMLYSNSMELSPSWEASDCAATQELPNILWKQKVHYHIHESPPLVPILGQIDPVHTTHLRLGLPNCLFPSDFPTNILYAFLSFPCVLHALPINMYSYMCSIDYPFISSRIIISTPESFLVIWLVN